MTDKYTIYLVNQSADSQQFWCFLSPPQELVNEPGVFANSSATLAVDPNDPALNRFVIPVQYVVGAGASNNAVGLNVEVLSDVTNQASLKDTWHANYADVPPNKGPKMLLTGKSAPDNTIQLVSNDFAKVSNEGAGWFSNQSFGILTDQGFIGMTWSPKASQIRTLTPKLKFYVSAGQYGSNALADWNEVSVDSAVITVPDSFAAMKCTVTYDQHGNWSVTAGPPAPHLLANNLAFFHSAQHGELLALAHLDQGGIATDIVKSVAWDRSAAEDGLEDGFTILTGTVTVATALTAAFTYFVLSGVQFTIDRPAAGATTFHFSYSGNLSAAAVKDLVTAGAQIILGGKQKEQLSLAGRGKEPTARR
jgi:hypothetical protein